MAQEKKDNYGTLDLITLSDDVVRFLSMRRECATAELDQVRESLASRFFAASKDIM